MSSRTSPAGSGASLADAAWPSDEDRSDLLKARYILRCHALEQLSEVLSKIGISALVVKGAGLAATVYSEPWLRAMGDIDVIVREPDLAPVRRALAAAGWQAMETAGRPLTEAYLEVAFRSPGEMGSVLLELHLGMDKVAFRRPDISEMFMRAERYPGLPALFVPSREDHTLLIALHLAADEFRHLPGFADLELLLSSSLDVDTLLARADCWSATTALHVCLRTLEALRPGVVPSAMIERTRPSRSRSALLSISFDVGSWPVTRTPPELGWQWMARQTLLRDDTLHWIRGVGAYAALRVIERARNGR